MAQAAKPPNAVPSKMHSEAIESRDIARRKPLMRIAADPTVASSAANENCKQRDC